MCRRAQARWPALVHDDEHLRSALLLPIPREVALALKSSLEIETTVLPLNPENRLITNRRYSKI
jgi:hypothetical protein